MTRKIAFTALASILAFGFAASSQAAFAQSQDEAINVSYADLNISTKAGAATLLHRIHNAADSICGVENIGPLDLQQAKAACAKSITDQTVARFNAPMVTALNSGQPQSAPTVVASSR